MRVALAFCSLSLIACTEAPRMQPLPPLPDSMEGPPPAPADLSSVVVPSVDLAAPMPTILGLSPRLVSTEGGQPVTITGSGFDRRAQVFVNHLTARITAVTENQIIFNAPPLPGLQGPVEVAVRNPDGQTATVAPTDAQRALSYYTSRVTFDIRANLYSNGDRGDNYGFALGDLNRDGNLDLVAATYGTRSVSIYLGNDDGTFPARPHNNYYVGGHPHTAVRMGDLNNDGNLDVIVGIYETDGNGYHIAWLRGDGTGNLASWQRIRNVVRYPFHLELGDFNGDNRLDVVTCSYTNDDRCSIILGDGQGGVGGYTEVTGVGSQGTRTVVGDFNKDGKLDFAVSVMNSQRITYYLGRGDGTFESPRYLGTQNLPHWMDVGDFNNDRNLDLIVSNHNSHTMGLYLGRGDGTFQDPVYINVGGRHPHEVRVGDFNGDGHQDFVVTIGESYNPGLVNLFLGRGNGTFNAGATYPLSNNQPYALAIGALGKQDRKLDIITGARSGNNSGYVVVLTNTAQ